MHHSPTTAQTHFWVSAAKTDGLYHQLQGEGG